MKAMKRLFAALMAVAMVCSLCVSTAFAADYSYKVYQIFTGDVSDSTLSNIKWGKAANITDSGKSVGDAVSSTVLNALDEVKDSSDREKLAVITTYWNKDSTEYTNATSKGSESVTVTGLTPGYYLVEDTSTIGNNDSYSTFVVKVTDGTLTFSRKSSAPEVVKKIKEGSAEQSANEASIGDTVSYEITGKLPSNIDDYNTYFYKFTDTLSKGLKYNEDLKVTIGGQNVTKYFWVKATTDSSTGKTTLVVAISDLFELANADEKVTINASTQIILAYSATLTEDATPATGDTNSVKVTYSNNPNISGDGRSENEPDEPKPTDPDHPDPEPTPTYPTGETTSSDVTTYTTSLTIQKVNEDRQNLKGAEFTLSGDGVNQVVINTKDTFVEDNTDGTYYELTDGTYTTTAPTGDTSNAYKDATKKYKKTTVTEVKSKADGTTSVTASTNAAGELTFTGLGAGTYTLTESNTPAGYNTIAPVTFTVKFDVATKTFSVENNTTIEAKNNLLSTTIVNERGSNLPTTGGMGTTLFYTVGAVLVVAAGVLLVAKRRMKAEE